MKPAQGRACGESTLLPTLSRSAEAHRDSYRQQIRSLASLQCPSVKSPRERQANQVLGSSTGHSASRFSNFSPIPISRPSRETRRRLPSSSVCQPYVVNASTERDFDAVFAKLHELRADALMISQDSFFNSQSVQLGALSARHGLPSENYQLAF